MKKEYAKPYLAFESFQLVAALAGACSGPGQVALNQSLEKCNAIDEANDFIFADACHTHADSLCYQGPHLEGLYLTS